MPMLAVGDLNLDHRPGASTLSARIGAELAWVEIRAPREVRERLRPDIAPFAAIAIAMGALSGSAVEIEAPVDDEYWTALTGGFAPFVSALFGKPEIALRRAGRRPAGKPSGETALLFSAGIDSFYSRKVLRGAGVTPRWYVNINAGAHDFDRACWDVRLRNVRAVADHDGAPLIVIDTNFHEVLKLDHVRSHLIRNLSAAFALAPAASHFVYSSACSFPDISFENGKTRGIAYLDHTVISTMTPSGLAVSVLGWEANRIAKVRAVADDPVVRAFLDVCINQTYQSSRSDDDPMNCGVCAKCLHTMLTLDRIGKREAFAAKFCWPEDTDERQARLDRLARDGLGLSAKFYEWALESAPETVDA